MRGRVVGLASALQLAALLGACSDAARGTPSSVAPLAAAGSHAADSGIAQAGVGAPGLADSGVALQPMDAAADPLPARPPQVQRSTVAANTAPEVSADDYLAFTRQLTAFGLDLGQTLVATEELSTRNSVYSPLSAAYALAMAYAGARGETAAELKEVLGDSFTDSTFHRAANRLARELQARAKLEPINPRMLELNLASALFLERSLELQPAFLDLLASEYDSGVQLVDFTNDFEGSRASINRWVADRTHDKILDLLPMGSVDARTNLVLVNALYFYARWAMPFVEGATRPAAFQTLSGETLQVDTMQGFEVFGRHVQTTDYSLAVLDYAGMQFSMTIVLPASGQFESVRSLVSRNWLLDARGGSQSRRLNIKLPKFRLSVGTISLKAGLEALGIKRAFSATADFSGVAPGLTLDDVLQKTCFSVDELGTEGASSTAATGNFAAWSDQPVPFVVDRPFLFFVHDADGVMLFSGHVVDPSKFE